MYDLVGKFLRLPRKLLQSFSHCWNRLRFRLHGIVLKEGSRIEGHVYIGRLGGARISTGRNLHIVSGLGINRIGRNLRCGIYAMPGAFIEIGDNTGISCSCIWAREKIVIGNNVNIGADSVIMDHDAHSLDSTARRDPAADREGTLSAPVCIGDDVLVGARTIILKGVSVGAGSIIGAGSVVTRNIPSGEIWAGNPAKKIRSLKD